MVRFFLRLAAFAFALGTALPTLAAQCPAGFPVGAKCTGIEEEIYTSPPAPAPYSSGLRIPAAPGPVSDTLQYIPANQFLTLGGSQMVTNKVIDCTQNTCLNFPGGGGGGSGFPFTLGSTSIAALASVPSVSALTLANPTLSGTVAGNPTFSGLPTYTGQPTYTGLPSGTCSLGVALDSGHHLVTTACSSGITQLTTDVLAGPGSGSQAASVIGLQGRPVLATLPTTGQLLGWNGTSWGPVNSLASGINQLTSDVAAGPGTGSQAATVTGLQGRGVASTAPTSGQLLGWNGSSWIPTTQAVNAINQITGDATGGPGAGSQAVLVTGLRGRPLDTTAPTTNQVLTWNGSSWIPAIVPVNGINQLVTDVTAGPGTGTQAATVTGLQGRAVASTAPTSNQILSWNGSSWTPTTLPPAGLNQLTSDVVAGPGAGSQVATVTGLQGRSVVATAPTLNQELAWNGSAWAPVTPPLSGMNQITGDATAGPGTGSQPITLALTGVTPGCYVLGSFAVTFDGKGRATSIVSGTCAGASVLLINTGSKMLSNTAVAILIQ